MIEIEKTISLIGCGWLGIPLGKKLIDCCCFVKGSTQRSEKLSVLRGHGIEPFQLTVHPKVEGFNLDEFFSSEVAIIMIPPLRSESEMVNYPKMINELLIHIQNSPIDKVLFISSTSVYPNLNREVLEDEAGGNIPKMGQIILEAEESIRKAKGLKTTVIRFSGLFGPGRHPGRFFAEKKGLTGGGDPINFIHLNDCTQVICELLRQEKWGYVFHASADRHPTKKEFYTKAAESLGLAPPEYIDDSTTAFKIISSNALKKELNYKFIYPDPIAALSTL